MDHALSSSFFSIFPKSSSFRSNPPQIISVFSSLPKINNNNHHQHLPSSLPKNKKIKKSSFARVLLNVIDEFMNNFFDDHNSTSSSSTLPCYIDPNYVLSENFAPVQELPPTECEILQGTLPPFLDGIYIRNGPNPQYFPKGPYHLFDGDGMLHSLRISKGNATLCSRFVKTYKYKVENEIGFPILPNFFAGFSHYGNLFAFIARISVLIATLLVGRFNPMINGFGLANTSLALIGGTLYALGESDLPYSLKITSDGDVVTLRRHDFDGKLSINMTAHPKTDPDTMETFSFKYGLFVPPFLTFFRINPDGEKQPDVPIFSIKHACLIHDFAITKKYAIFPDIQIEFNPLRDIIMNGRSSSPLGTTNLRKVPRLGVIPRYAEDESEMKWFQVSGFNIAHATNAWDEEDNIILVGPNILSIENALKNTDLIHGSMEKVKIDLKTGNVSRLPLSTRNLEFPTINPAYIGKKTRYIYAGIGNPLPKISGVVKLDLTISSTDQKECIVATRMFEEGCFGGEPFFVAKETNNNNNNNNNNGKEDDGYIITYVHNERRGESTFWVMDAKSPNLEIVCIVKLPQRVPYGFHGLFIKETDLNI